MTMKTHVRRPEHGAAVVGIDGEFGASDADHLFAVSIGVEADGPVAIDFHDARTVDDTALVKLAQEFSGCAGRFKLVGLSEHHHRLLRYIGLEQEHDRPLDAD